MKMKTYRWQCIPALGLMLLLWVSLASAAETANGSPCGGLMDATSQAISVRLSNIDMAYDYNPVPIPEPVWLLGSGIAGLIGLKRRLQGE